MNLYPISLNVEDRPCLVVGGGRIALPKARSLAECGAQVTVVSPRFIPGFDELEIVRVQREFREEDLNDAFIVIAATDDRFVNRAVGEVCRDRGVLCNVVDDPDACDFFLNAVVRRGDLAIAVSTSGASPALSKRVRRDLEGRYPADYEGYVAFLRRARETVRDQVSTPASRSEISAELASEEGYRQYRHFDEAQRTAWVEKLIARNTPGAAS